MFGFLVLIALFVAFTPGILFKLKGSKMVVAAMHAVLFGLVVCLLRGSVEGFQEFDDESPDESPDDSDALYRPMYCFPPPPTTVLPAPVSVFYDRTNNIFKDSSGTTYEVNRCVDLNWYNINHSGFRDKQFNPISVGDTLYCTRETPPPPIIVESLFDFKNNMFVGTDGQKYQGRMCTRFIPDVPDICPTGSKQQYMIPLFKRMCVDSTPPECPPDTIPGGTSGFSSTIICNSKNTIEATTSPARVSCVGRSSPVTSTNGGSEAPTTFGPWCARLQNGKWIFSRGYFTCGIRNSGGVAVGSKNTHGDATNSTGTSYINNFNNSNSIHWKATSYRCAAQTNATSPKCRDGFIQINNRCVSTPFCPPGYLLKSLTMGNTCKWPNP